MNARVAENRAPLRSPLSLFRSPQEAPSRWKMALLTWIAVWPVSIAEQALLNPLIGQSAPRVVHAGAVAGAIVVVLTWVAMPLLVRVARRFLQPAVHPSSDLVKSHGSVR